MGWLRWLAPRPLLRCPPAGSTRRALQPGRRSEATLTAAQALAWHIDYWSARADRLERLARALAGTALPDALLQRVRQAQVEASLLAMACRTLAALGPVAEPMTARDHKLLLMPPLGDARQVAVEDLVARLQAVGHPVDAAFVLGRLAVLAYRHGYTRLRFSVCWQWPGIGTQRPNGCCRGSEPAPAS